MVANLLFSNTVYTNTGLYMIGGGLGYDGMYQIMIRLPNQRDSAVSSDELPTDETIEVQAFTNRRISDVDYNYTSHVFTRTIQSGSKTVPIYTKLYGGYSRSDAFVQLIFDKPVYIADRTETYDYVDRLTNDRLEYGAVLADPGDTVVAALSHTSSVYSTQSLPSEFTAIQGSSAKYKAGYFRSTGGRYQVPAYTNYAGNQSPEHGAFYVFREKSSGISFQIMHNGQLIPATPNLWSGGQLTPVGLNLPE